VQVDELLQILGAVALPDVGGDGALPCVLVLVKVMLTLPFTGRL